MTPTFDIVFGVSEAIGLACACHAVLSRRRESSGALAWALGAMLPIVGPLIYLTMGIDRAGRRRRHRVRNVRAQHHRHIEEARRCWREALTNSSGLIRRAIQDQGYFPPCFGNQVRLFTTGETTLESMKRDIASARTSVDMMTYIVDDDPHTDAMAQQLVGAVRRGVAVRVVYDYMGASDGRGLIRKLKDGGVSVLPYLAPHPLRRGLQISLRNHRKLLVVDGEIAYIGSMNLSGRHCGSPPQSLDITVRMEGPVALDCASIVDADWAFASAERKRRWHWSAEDPESFRTLADVRPRACVVGQGPDEVLQVVPSGPDDPSLGVMRMLITAIHQAERSIDLITPYFVPPQPLLGALQSATARGVSVRLIVPKRTDSWLVTAAMMTWVSVALEYEIAVRARSGPLLHEKFAVIDENLAFMGSSNLDQRSTFLNFEADIVAYGAGLPRTLRAHFEDHWCASEPYSIPIWMLPRAVRRRGDTKPWVKADESARITHSFRRLGYRLAWLCSPIL